MSGARTPDPGEGAPVERAEVLIRQLGPGDADVLERVEPDVFDETVRIDLAQEFLDDPRHHIVVALHGDHVVGFASAVHYLHPDKPAELFVNEIAVAPRLQRQGIARRLLSAILRRGRALGCHCAWVLTEAGNDPARALYAAAGGQEELTSVLYSFTLDQGD